MYSVSDAVQNLTLVQFNNTDAGIEFKIASSVQEKAKYAWMGLYDPEGQAVQYGSILGDICDSIRCAFNFQSFGYETGKYCALVQLYTSDLKTQPVGDNSTSCANFTGGQFSAVKCITHL